MSSKLGRVGRRGRAHVVCEKEDELGFGQKLDLLDLLDAHDLLEG